MVCTAPRRGVGNRIIALAIVVAVIVGRRAVKRKPLCLSTRVTSPAFEHRVAFIMANMAPFFHPGRALLFGATQESCLNPMLSHLALIAPLAW